VERRSSKEGMARELEKGRRNGVGVPFGGVMAQMFKKKKSLLP